MDRYFSQVYKTNQVETILIFMQYTSFVYEMNFLIKT